MSFEGGRFAPSYAENGCVECGATARGKYAGPCAACGAPTCPQHSYFYADESNRAVTASAKPMCVVHRDREPGVLGLDNLLSSGDFEHRLCARARFKVELTEFGSRIVARQRVAA